MSSVPRPKQPWHRTEREVREYFDLFGDGLVVVLPPRAPDPSSEEWTPPTGGAWLHVGADGGIHAFTGKVDVGQGTRNALRLLVAEELRVDPERVEVIAGDTDLSPWDMGTFGSRSMPDAGPALQCVAATARLALAELGRATPKEGSRGPTTTEWSRFLRGRREIRLASAPFAVTPASAWTRAGRPWTDRAAEEVVTGRREFVTDLSLPGMLHGAVLRPPRYGDALESVDVTRASALPGIRVVQESGFVGVVAPTPAAARAAVRALEPQWKEAAQPDEGGIEAYLRSHPTTDDVWDADRDTAGDPDALLATSRQTLAATYRTAYIAHVPLEPRAALAAWEDGRLTVWVGTQTPFRTADHVAQALKIPPGDVRVVCPPTGSGFGGKHGGGVALEAARLARAAGHPVRVAYSREEEFRYGYLRPMAIVDVRAGLDEQGRLSSWTFRNYNAGAAALRTPYRVEHRRVDNVLTGSPLPQGSYRALAATANTFAREVAMDELAALRHEDPKQFRERHLEDDRLLAVLRAVTDRAGWSSWKRSGGRGHGLGLSVEKGGRVATVAEVTVSTERAVRVDRLVTAYEAGAIVHPENLRSQVEGATVMGLGGALFEAIHFQPGRLTNASLSSYRVPRFSDVPLVEVLLLDRPDLPSAGGGETPLIAVAPALGNAIYDACGIRLRSLPLLPLETPAPSAPAVE